MSGFIGEAVKKMKRGWLEILDKDNIIYDENNYPHFGTKRKAIRKAWVGNTNNEPELALYANDYNYDDPSTYKLPFSFYDGCAVVYNNKIHLLGGSEHPRAHYSYDGVSWTEESELPYDFINGLAVSYNISQTFGDALFIIGGSGNNVGFYKYSNHAWIKLTNTPVPITRRGVAAVLNMTIYIIIPATSGNVFYRIYRPDYSMPTPKWVSFTGFSYNYRVIGASAVVYNNKIHILGSNRHISYNGSQWTDESNSSVVPYNFYNGAAVVYNNDIYLIGGGGDSTGFYRINNYGRWTDLPDYFINGSAVVYNDKIYIFGGINRINSSTYYNKFIYYYCETIEHGFLKWSERKDILPFELVNGSSVIYKNNIHIMGKVKYNNESDNNGICYVHYSYPYADDPIVKWKKLGEWAISEEDSENKLFNKVSMAINNEELYALESGRINKTFAYVYKYDDVNDHWDYFNALGYSLSYGIIINYNNNLYILASCYESLDEIYGGLFILNNDSWEGKETPPCNVVKSSAVVYNNKIHLLGGSEHPRAHYSYDGNSWTKESELPYDFINGSAVVHEGNLHLLGGSGNLTSHYIYKEGVWQKWYDLPYNFEGGSCISYDDNINILGGSYESLEICKTNLHHYFN